MKVDINRVKHTYNGRDGRCCCGCSGKHVYTEASADQAEQMLGYRPDVSDRSVASTIRKIQNSTDPDADFDYGTCVGTVVGTRIYIAYYDH